MATTSSGLHAVRSTIDRRAVVDPALLDASLQRTLAHAALRRPASAAPAVTTTASRPLDGSAHTASAAAAASTSNLLAVAAPSTDASDSSSAPLELGLALMLHAERMARAMDPTRAQPHDRHAHRMRPTNASDVEHTSTGQAGSLHSRTSSGVVSSAADLLGAQLDAARHDSEKRTRQTGKRIRARHSSIDSTHARRLSISSEDSSLATAAVAAVAPSSAASIGNSSISADFLSSLDWSRVLGFTGADDAHLFLRRFACDVRDADDIGRLLKSHEWEAYLREAFDRRGENYRRHVLTRSIGIALATYHTSADEMVLQLSSLLVFGPMANETRAVAAMSRRLRDDIESGRFTALVLTLMHRSYGIPGTTPTQASMHAWLTRARESATPTTRNEAASAAHGRHGRVLQSRPISAPPPRHSSTNHRRGALDAAGVTEDVDARRHTSDIACKQDTLPKARFQITRPSSMYGRPISAARSVSSTGAQNRVLSHAASRSTRPSSAMFASMATNPYAPHGSHQRHDSDLSDPAPPVPLSTLRDDAPQLLQQLNALASRPKSARAHPSHIETAEWQRSQIDLSPYATETPLVVALTQRLQRQRVSERDRLSHSIAGRVVTVAQQLDERQAELKTTDSLHMEERGDTLRTLAQDSFHRSLVFDQLDEEFAGAVKQSRWIAQRGAAEASQWRDHFPTQIIETVDFPAENPLAPSTVKTEPFSSRPPRAPLQFPLVASRPTSARFVSAASMVADAPPRDRPYSVDSSTAPEIFPSFRGGFRLNPFQLPVRLSPSVPSQEYSAEGADLWPAPCAFGLDGITLSRTKAPFTFGRDDARDEYWNVDLQVSSPRPSPSPTASDAADRDVSLEELLARIGIDYDLIRRRAQERCDRELAEEQRRRRRAYEIETEIGRELTAKMESAQRRAKAAAAATAAANRAASPKKRRQQSPAIAGFVDETTGIASSHRAHPRLRHTALGPDPAAARQMKRLRTMRRLTTDSIDSISSTDASTTDDSSESAAGADLSDGSHEDEDDDDDASAERDGTGGLSATPSSILTHVSDYHARLLASLSDPTGGPSAVPPLPRAGDSASQWREDRLRLIALARALYDADPDAQREARRRQEQQEVKAQRKRQKRARDEGERKEEEGMRSRLRSACRRLTLSADDRRTVVAKYARGPSAATLATAIGDWEQCAEFWHARTQALAARSSTADPSSGTPPPSSRSVHDSGGDDAHSNLLVLTLQSAVACAHLYVTHDDWLALENDSLISQLLVGIDFDCCDAARQVRDEVRNIEQEMQRRRTQQVSGDSAERSPSVQSAADPVSSQADAELSQTDQDAANVKSTPKDEVSTAPSSQSSLPDDSAPSPTAPLSTTSSTEAVPTTVAPPADRPISATSAWRLPAAPLDADSFSRFVKPPLLHPRPLIPGEFMTLIRGASLLDLPDARLQPTTNDVGARDKSESKSSSSSRPRTAVARADQWQSTRASQPRVDPVSSAGLAAHIQQRVNNKQWKLFR